MSTLVAGVALWVVVHLIPSLAAGYRQRVIDKFGASPYRAVFTIAILTSIVIIVVGWRSSPEQYLYVLPPWSRPAGFTLMMISFLLLGAANYQTIIKRFVRHPMLLGVVVWSVSHLLTNGTIRALVLFGGLGLWALIEMALITHRDGVRDLPAGPGLGAEMKGIAISAIIFLLVLFLHPYFTGVSAMLR
mgnify:CR=1 FL=1|tara:strand:+ start:11635 stop:12201 length:567 start_codon:yes stop_codon:yes gene_type:complete